jgi:hypothetical protein
MEQIMQNLKNFICLCAAIFLLSNAALGKFQFVDNSNYLDSTVFFSFADNFPPNVERLNLSQDVIFINCKDTEERCSENKKTIDIRTEEENLINSVITFEYAVTGGKIIGEGKNVVWDLSEAKPGEYEITAGVNDGCGICGRTKTRTVYVVECPENVVQNGTVTPGFVSLLRLDKTEVFEKCPLPTKRKKKRETCSKEENLIKVSTNLLNPVNYKAIYKYEVSGGRIIGNGENVEWDLSEVAPGTYTITASADVGRGFCANSVSQTVTVVECSKCKKGK